MQGNYKAVANCERLKCIACEFVKGHLQSNKVNTIKNNTMKKQELEKDHLMPGQIVSAYHYILQDIGRLYHTKVNSDTYDMFSGGCVFIDHASGYVNIKPQVSINETETMNSKLTFEREAQIQVVVIKGCRTDNEIFNASEFV